MIALTMVSSQGEEYYVKADASPNGHGSEAQPFNSLQAVEAVAGEGDVIFVMLPDDPKMALEGGITLKDGQKLLGLGEAKPRITNSGSSVKVRHPRSPENTLLKDGDAITLANDNEVAGLHLFNPRRHGLLGVNATGFHIHDNEISGFNLGQVQVPDLTIDNRGRFPWESIPGVSGAAAMEIVFNAIELPESVDSGSNRIHSNTIRDGFGGGIWISLQNSSGIDLAITDTTMSAMKDHRASLGRAALTGLRVFASESQAKILLSHCRIEDVRGPSEGMLINAVRDSELDVEVSKLTCYGVNAAWDNAAFVSGVNLAGQVSSSLKFKMENSTIAGWGGPGVGVFNLTGKPLGQEIDLGGGNLGSVGLNRIYNNGLGSSTLRRYYHHDAMGIVDGDVSAKNNWWGSAEGICYTRTLAVPSKPAGCARVFLLEGDSQLEWEPHLTEDPLAEPVAVRLERDEDLIRVSWPLVGNFFELVASDQPTGPWTKVSLKVTRQNGRLSVDVPVESEHSFYQLIQKPASTR